jgi:hypothetical protein
MLPQIGNNRQNAHLRDFKYTPENIEEYLTGEGGPNSKKQDKNKAKTLMIMPYSNTVGQ